jgi:hypothetical protein
MACLVLNCEGVGLVSGVPTTRQIIGKREIVNGLISMIVIVG